MAKAVVREPVDSDFLVWRVLWQQYLAFYETVKSERHAESLWQRLFDTDEPAECLVAEMEGGVVWIVHYLPHADTWDERSICYVSDLFVDPAARGKGVGRLLLGAVGQRAKLQGWSSVYWQTAEDNNQARILYDRITGGASGFIIYELDLGKDRSTT